MFGLSRERSAMVYGVMDEIVTFARQLLLIAAAVGVGVGVGQYLGTERHGLFGQRVAEIEVLFWGLTVLFITGACAVTTSHKIRIHIAKSSPSTWNDKQSRLVMASVTGMLLALAFAVLWGVMDILLR